MCPFSAAAVMERKGDKNKSLLEQQNTIECVPMTSRRPWWRSKHFYANPSFCFIMQISHWYVQTIELDCPLTMYLCSSSSSLSLGHREIIAFVMIAMFVTIGNAIHYHQSQSSSSLMTTIIIMQNLSALLCPRTMV